MSEKGETSMKKTMLTSVMAVAVMVAIAPVAQATALSAARDTPMRTGELLAASVASNTTLYAGAMVALNATGYAVPASDATGLKVLGRCEASVVNAGADGAAIVTIRRGVFRWANGDTFTRADIGTLAVVEDDATVQKAASATYDIIAGLIVDVDSDGVWVDTYSLPASGSATVVNLTATGNAAITGNATVGGTLTTTGATTLTGNALVNEVDTRTATALLLGKATATGVTLGAADAHTTVAGNLLATDVDAATATTLLLGKATATKVEIADTGIETEIQGTLDAQEAATFASTVGITGVLTLTAAPKLTAVTTAGSETVALTNAPAAGNAIWANIAVGASTYVIPLFPAE